MLPAAVIHVIHRNIAVKAITDISGPDLVVLGILRIVNCPLSFTALYDHYLQLGYGSPVTLTNALRDCAAMNYLARIRVGNRSSYCITSEGKVLLDRINLQLDNYVKELVMRYDIQRS